MGFKGIPTAIAIAIGLLIWFVIPVPDGVAPNAWHLLALFVATIAAIIGKAMPIGALSILAIALVALTGVTNDKPSDAIADALSGRQGALRHVAGTLNWDHGLPCIEPWAIACDSVTVPDFATAASGALAQLPLGMTHHHSDDPCARHLEALRQHLALLLHHGLARLPRGWGNDAGQIARQLDGAGLRALARHLRELAPEVAAAQANPGEAQLAPALMTLLALRQLHADASAIRPLDGSFSDGTASS